MNQGKNLQPEQPVKLATFGMDDRSQKMLVMFLQGPCRGSAIIVEDVEADADLIDIDSVASKQLLEQRKAINPGRPIIVISLQAINLDDVVFLKKPIQIVPMLDTILRIRKTLNDQSNVNDQQKKMQRLKQLTSVNKESDESATRIVIKDATTQKQAVPEVKKNLNFEERKKTSKHKTAMLLDDKSFSSYIGLLPGIDFDDRSQLAYASYNAKEFFQGYVQSAYNLSRAKGRVINLNSAWKSVSIFPFSKEVWIDAHDTQLRSFSAVPVSTFAGDQGGNITITPVDPKNKPEKVDLEKFQSMDAFLWKVAIWTSKGRFPQGINIDQPVFIKQWPNFTRLVITPHALRITALLMEGPRTLINIAETLNIKYQYVFIYFSAVYALGIAGQAERRSDAIVAPSELKPNKKKGLLTRIMSKLRGAE